MPTDNVIPLFPRRGSRGQGWRRKARAVAAFGGACALALAPLSVAAEGAVAGRLPPGHPPIESRELPPGHPPVQSGPEQACTPALPEGHPSVQDPRLPPGHPPIEMKPCAPGAGATSNGVYHPDAFQDAKTRVIET